MRVVNYIASAYLTPRIHTQCKKATAIADFLGAKATLRQHLHRTTLFNNT